MIGLAATAAEFETAREFFELFKTPWEPAAAGRRYAAVLSTIGLPRSLEADLVVAFGSKFSNIDEASGVTVREREVAGGCEWNGRTFPLFGRAATFGKRSQANIRCAEEALDYRSHQAGGHIWRIGYDLLDEVRQLLGSGQPASWALSPTLELHIAILRHVLVESGVPFIEVPPRPAGRQFVCCLTHDVDFFGIRRHLFDGTLAGFLARATAGTLIDLLRGTRSIGEAARNFSAALSLPLVFLGIARDPWNPIRDYAIADGKRPSTFFVVPFDHRPGSNAVGHVDRRRGVKYRAGDLRGQIHSALDRGAELAVHGIDAWRDEDAGRRERSVIASLSGRAVDGIRMHWLYFADDSPARLEAARFGYDSTCGYNDAVGFRAGTGQAFRPAGCEHLLELPLAIMDTAMFYPTRMGLRRQDGIAVCRRIVADARRFGGALVVNWHDRSLSPERLWKSAYVQLLEEIDAGTGAWYATAADAVAWFRWRRSVRFERHADEAILVTADPLPQDLPSATIAVHARHAGTLEQEIGNGGAVRISV